MCNNKEAKTASLVILLASVLLSSAFAGVQFVGKVSAEGYTETTGTLDGADFALRIPDPWNAGDYLPRIQQYTRRPGNVVELRRHYVEPRICNCCI